MRIAVPLITVLGALVVLVAAPSRSTVAGPAAAPGPHPADIHPPPLHSRDMMRRAGGVLWWVGTGCRLERVTMSTLVATDARTRECRAWPSPDGTVVLAQGRPAGAPVVALSGSSMQELQPTTVRGRVDGVTWSADSELRGGVYVRSPPRGQGPAPGRAVPKERDGRLPLHHPPSPRRGHAHVRRTRRLRERRLAAAGQALEIAAGRPRHGYVVTALTATSSGLAVAVAPVDPNDPNAQFAILVLNRETGSSSTFRTNLRDIAPGRGARWQRVLVRAGAGP